MTEETGEQSPKKPVPEFIRQAGLAGLGLIAVAAESASRGFQYLVAKGEEFEPQGRERMKAVGEKVQQALRDAGGRLRSTASRGEEVLDEKVAAALRRAGLPTREDLKAFTERLEALAARIEELRSKPEATGS